MLRARAIGQDAQGAFGIADEEQRPRELLHRATRNACYWIVGGILGVIVIHLARVSSDNNDLESLEVALVAQTS